MRLTFASLIFALALVAIGCAGTETGNGMKDKEHTAKVEVKLTDAALSSGQFVALDSDGSEITITDAWASVDRIDLFLADGTSCAEVLDPEDGALQGGEPAFAPRCLDDDDATLRIDGPFWIDLITGEADPSLDMVYVPPGVYVGGSVKLHPRSPADPHNEDVLADATLGAEGTLANGDAFTLGLRFTDNIPFEGEITADEALAGIGLLLDVDSWFVDLPIAECADAGNFTVDADGTWVISDGKGGCNQAEKVITTAIKASGRLTSTSE